MIKTQEWPQWRSLGSLVGVAAAVLLMGGLVAGPAVAAGSTSAQPGGYLVQPNRFRSATVEFRVPTLTCTHRSTTRLRLGLFGHTSQSHTRMPWFATATVVCHNGKQRSYAVFGDYTPVQKKPVHPGDLVRVTTRGNNPWSTVADLTSGVRLAGGPLEIDQRTVPRVVIGARLTGTRLGRLQVAMTHGAVNKKPISALTHRRVAELVGRRVVTHPSVLNATGTGFALHLR